MGWNGVPYNCEMYSRNRPPSNAGQAFIQRVPGGHAQPAGFPRSMSSPGQQHSQNSRWILIQNHGQVVNWGSYYFSQTFVYRILFLRTSVIFAVFFENYCCF